MLYSCVWMDVLYNCLRVSQDEFVVQLLCWLVCVGVLNGQWCVGDSKTVDYILCLFCQFRFDI